MSNKLTIKTLNKGQEKNCIQKKWYNKEEDLLRYTAENWLSKEINKNRSLSFDLLRSPEAFYLTAKIDQTFAPWEIDEKMKVVILCDIMHEGTPWAMGNKFKIIMPIDDYLPEKQVSFLCHKAVITISQTFKEGGQWMERLVGSEAHLADIWINEVAR